MNNADGSISLQGLSGRTHCAEQVFKANQNSNAFKVLNGKDIDDIPAIYKVPTLRSYEFAAVGVWIDKRIVPGFRYRVRPIDSEVSYNLCAS